MDNEKIAKELLDVAKELTAGDGRAEAFKLMSAVPNGSMTLALYELARFQQQKAAGGDVEGRKIYDILMQAAKQVEKHDGNLRWLKENR